MKNWTRTGLILLATWTLAPFVVSSGASAQAPDADAEFLGLLDRFRAGEVAPEISFLDGQGSEVSLSTYAGEALVVNFWATWCAPCIAEMPALDRLNQAVSEAGGRVIAINTDFQPEAGPEWLIENQIETLEAFYDSTGAAFFDSGASGLPYSLVIAPDGTVVAEVFGDAHWDTPAAIELVTELAELSS